MVPGSDLMLDTMSAHELTHALQDPHFDLERFLPADGMLSVDGADDTAAIDALVRSTKLDGGNGHLGIAGGIAIRGTCVPMNQCFSESTVKVRS